MRPTRTTPEAVQKLIVAMLSVNSFPLEKVWSYYGTLSEQLLLDLEHVSNAKEEEIAQRLVRAGYSRGAYMNYLLAERLLCTCRFLNGGGLEGFIRACETRSLDNVGVALKGARGIGPTVLRNFALLMDW